MTAPVVTLERAGEDAAPLLSNLLELYVHDLSEIFPVQLGSEGRYGYERLPLYWSEPETRHAFLIRCDGKIAGFTFATRGSPATDDPSDLDVAEFFVLRSHRRLGVGREAAFALWRALPGRWVVRVSEANRGGVPFWSDVVRDFSGGAFTESARPGKPHRWRVFQFESGAGERT